MGTFYESIISSIAKTSTLGEYTPWIAEKEGRKFLNRYSRVAYPFKNKLKAYITSTLSLLTGNYSAAPHPESALTCARSARPAYKCIEVFAYLLSELLEHIWSTAEQLHSVLF